MANIAPIVNTRGPLFVHPEGVVRRTHFHTMAMYANELEPFVGRLERSGPSLGGGERSVPVVDAIATSDEAGARWAVALVNRHPEEAVACTVELGGRPLDGTFAATVLTADSPDAYNDIEHPDRVRPERVELTFREGAAELPPHSLTIVRIER